uniref:Uncharacterized protein n=1 Tax=Anopheles coluzzii TaxID=1518534 RepID=A0A8W7PNA2_ANOCL
MLLNSCSSSSLKRYRSRSRPRVGGGGPSLCGVPTVTLETVDNFRRFWAFAFIMFWGVMVWSERRSVSISSKLDERWLLFLPRPNRAGLDRTWGRALVNPAVSAEALVGLLRTPCPPCGPPLTTATGWPVGDEFTSLCMFPF